MISEPSLEEIIKSHYEVQKNNLFNYGSLKNKLHKGVLPFDDNDVKGDFIYNGNKIEKRYSPLYDTLLSEGEVFNNCQMDSGYTVLFVCEKILFVQGELKIASKPFQIFSNDQVITKNKYCVFQNPLTKLFQHGHKDIIGVFVTLAEAHDFSNKFSQDEGISSLISKIKFIINWH